MVDGGKCVFVQSPQPTLSTHEIIFLFLVERTFDEVQEQITALVSCVAQVILTAS